MTAPAFLTRIDIEPGRILVEVDVHAGDQLTDEQAGRLRGRLHEAVEDALASSWPEGDQTLGDLMRMAGVAEGGRGR